MPKVPVIESQQIAPEALGLPSLNVSTSAQTEGAAIGQGLSSLGQAVFKRGLEMKREDDANKGMEAFATASDLLREHEHGENGVLTRRGKNALGIVDETDTRAAEIFKDVSFDLKNDEQKRAFKALWGRRREAALNRSSRHESGQRQVFKDETTQAIISDSINQASSNFTDQDSINNAKLNIRASILANGQGKSEEVLQLQELAALTTLHTEVIKRLMVDNPTMARIHFNNSVHEIDPKEVVGIKEALRKADLTERGQGIADDIMGSDKSDREKLESARAIENPEVRDETTRRVKIRIAEDKTLEDTEQRKASENRWKVLEESKKDGFSTASLLSIIDTEPKAAVRKSMNVWLSKKIKGVDVETDWKEFYKLETLAADRPQEFKNMDLNQFFHVLSDSERKTLISKQGSIDGSGDVEGRTLLQQINSSLRQIGIDPGNGGSKKEQKKTADFFKFVREEMQIRQKETGNKPTQNDVQSIIDRGMIEGEVEGGFFGDPDVRLFEVTPDQRFFIDDVPDDDKSEITNALKRAGIPVTEEAIIDLFTRSQIKR